MAQAKANGIEIEYESFGDSRAPAIVLVMGLGAQLVRWPMPMVEALVARGHRVVRFDNRDVGLSSKLDHAGTPNLLLAAAQRMLGIAPRAPYSLTEMAADTVGLMDALGIGAAHIVGASMGGMIAQLVAAGWPERTRSLVSIMSTSGNPRLPGATPRCAGLLIGRPRGDDLEALVAHGMLAARVVSGAFPMEEAALSLRIREEIARNHHPAGFVRQMAAILADGDRRARLARIAAPTLVIHGTDDPLVHVAGGRDTAAAIPGARLLEIAGMGHTLPPQLVPRIVDAIAGHAAEPERLAA